VKDRLRLGGSLRPQARYSPLFIENVMAGFWEAEILRGRPSPSVPFNKPRISCLTKAQINKKVKDAMNAESETNVLIDYRRFSMYSDC
jgi:hypothetical protein